MLKTEFARYLVTPANAIPAGEGGRQKAGRLRGEAELRTRRCRRENHFQITGRRLDLRLLILRCLKIKRSYFCGQNRDISMRSSHGSAINNRYGGEEIDSTPIALGIVRAQCVARQAVELSLESRRAI